MKKFVSILSLTLVAVLLCATLASCGVSGTYKSAEVFGSYTQYTFKGSKVIADVYLAGVKATDSFEGKYKIKNGEITFTWKDSDGNEKSSTATFEKVDKKTIKIGNLTLTKQ